MPIARDQLSTAMLDHGECPEAVVLQFENQVGIIEGSGPLQEREGTPTISEYQNRMLRYKGERSEVVVQFEIHGYSA